MPPVRLSIDTPFSNSQHLRHSFRYAQVDSLDRIVDKIWVWNTVDEDVPTEFIIKEKVYKIETATNPRYEPNKVLDKNDYFFAILDADSQAIYNCRIGLVKTGLAGAVTIFNTNV